MTIIHGQNGRESKKTDYGQEESIAVFNQDPRIYQTTVKEFILDKKWSGKRSSNCFIRAKRK